LTTGFIDLIEVFRSGWSFTAQAAFPQKPHLKSANEPKACNMRKTMCEVCKAYAIYYVMGKPFCAECKERERTIKANAGVKK